MRALAFAIFFSVLGVVTPAFAQESAVISDEQQALARRLVSVGGSEALFIESAITGFEASAAAAGAPLTASQRTQLRPILNEAFAAPARVFVDELTAYVARTSRREDLIAALAYYESEAGQRYAAAVVEMTLALSLASVSGGATALPAVPSEAELDPTSLAYARRLSTAFQRRFAEVDVERLAATGIDSAAMADWLGRFLAGRLNASDLEAASVWAESEESLRLEGPSAERAAAEELAMLRAVRALDTDALRQQFERVRRENPA